MNILTTKFQQAIKRKRKYLFFFFGFLLLMGLLLMIIYFLIFKDNTIIGVLSNAFLSSIAYFISLTLYEVKIKPLNKFIVIYQQIRYGLIEEKKVVVNSISEEIIFLDKIGFRQVFYLFEEKEEFCYCLSNIDYQALVGKQLIIRVNNSKLVSYEGEKNA